MLNEISTNILLHPGGGGAQYPWRFKPFRPRNLWRRTPGPRPPGGPTTGFRITITLVAVALIVAAIIVAFTSDWFGSSEPGESQAVSVEHVETSGFAIQQNFLDGRVRVLNGEFQGIRASILIPEDDQVITAGIPEVQRAAGNLQLEGNLGAPLRAGEALVLCPPVPQCTSLVVALAEAVFDS